MKARRRAQFASAVEASILSLLEAISDSLGRGAASASERILRPSTWPAAQCIGSRHVPEEPFVLLGAFFSC